MKTNPLRLSCPLILALVLMLFAAGVQAAARHTLTGVDIDSGQGSQVALRLTFNGTAPDPSTFTVADPSSLSIDLPNTELAVDKHYRTIADGPIQALSMASANGKTRVVVELTRLVPHDIQRDGNTLLVRFGDSVSSSASTSQASARTTSADTTQITGAADGQATAIRDIDFRRGAQGAGRVMVTLNGSQTPINVDRNGHQIVVSLPGVALPQRLARRLDVTDFATPVETIDAMPQGQGTRLVITPNKNTDFQRLAYQVGNKLVIELQPVSQAEKQRQAAEHPQYDGKKISLSFQNIPVRAVLQIIANVANVNMVVSDDVNGNIALQLKDVPWDQALDVILNAKGLGMRRVNNVITVAPLSDIAARQKAEAAAREATNNLAPLVSQIIQINYANAADIANILQSDSVPGGSTSNSPINNNSISPADTGGSNALAQALSNNVPRVRNNTNPSAATGGDADAQSLLSPRGHVTVDQRTNSLLVTDTAANIDKIRSLIAKLDVPVRQVLIQSRIVVANRDFTRSLGISQTGVDNSRLNDALSAQNGGDLSSPYNANNSGYSIGLPATNATSVLASSIITDTFSLNLELSAMESENNGEIISSPRVITTDGREANIEQGREIPYQSGTSGSLAGSSVEFKKAVLSLNVTPKITPDDKVLMNLNVTQDSVGQTVQTSQGGAVPSIDTRSLTTQVLVDNGDTVVLGGIYEQNNTNQTGGVPFLRKIPLLGALFRNQSLEHQKRELLIFVTPRVLGTKVASE